MHHFSPDTNVQTRQTELDMHVPLFTQLCNISKAKKKSHELKFDELLRNALMSLVLVRILRVAVGPAGHCLS